MSKPDLEAFRLHLVEQDGYLPNTAADAVWLVKRFLKFAGSKRVDLITADETRQFFLQFKTKKTKSSYALVITKYMKFATAGLPVMVNSAGAAMPPLPSKLAKRWSADKIEAQKEAAEELNIKIGRQLISHFLYFQNRLNGEPENLDDIARFAAEAQELIQSNVALFVSLSVSGRSVHFQLDKRINR